MNNDTKSTNINIPYVSKRKDELRLFDIVDIPVHDNTREQISAVFDYWVETCRDTGRPPKLDAKRTRAITKALKLYDVDTLKTAIDGVMLSDFHQGENDRERVYDEITLILRDSEHIEEFIAYTEEGTA